MSEQKESSVLFSLKELMNLEEDRIKQEETDRQRRADAERKAREDAELRARQEEEARIKAEEERRRLEEQRSREEQARLEAIRAAEIERQRIEAERRAQLEAAAQQQAHAQKLAMIANDDEKKKIRTRLIGISVGAVLLFGGIAGYVFGVYMPAKAEQDRIAAANLKAAQDENEKYKAQAAEAEAEKAKLNAALADAKDDATRAKIQAELAAQQKKIDDAKAGAGRVGGPVGARPAGPSGGTPHSNCDPKDPLCGN